jgi:NAD(P)H-hydrate epimerase
MPSRVRLPSVLLRENKLAHKNDFGHVLVCAGSPSMLGAACLVSLAAMRFGAGLVTAAVPKALNLTLQEKLAHVIMTMPVPGGRGDVFAAGSFVSIKRSWGKYTAVAIGPGIGLAPGTIKFVREMVRQCPLPMVIDADALNALGTARDFGQAPRVLTPHPGEFYRLSGLKPETDKDRRRAALGFSMANNVVLVLKGHRTVVASPDGKVYVNTTGNAGMAKAGMGDVLTGMITALLAQGVGAFNAARFSVFAHGYAGDRVVKDIPVYSLMATDLVNAVKGRINVG